jgi:hypothetical protein
VVYVPDSPRFSPIDPQSESIMCMSQHPQAVQEFIRDNNYQDVADLLEPPHYNRVGKLTVQHYRRARELSWESLEVHGFNTASVRDEASSKRRPQGRCLQSSHLERSLYKYDLMLLAEWYPRGLLWRDQ